MSIHDRPTQDPLATKPAEQSPKNLVAITFTAMLLISAIDMLLNGVN